MKTTKRHFEIFKKECQKWIDKLELNHWDIEYRWEDLDAKGFDGAYNVGYGDYHATVWLDTDFEEVKVTDEEVRLSAKHEIIHILLKRFAVNACSRFINKSELNEAEEELVRKLCKIIK